MSAYQDFENHFAEINDLCCTLNLLNWDSNTQMPEEGASTRGSQIATLARIAQQKFISSKSLALIEAAEKEIASEMAPDTFRARALTQARDAYMISVRIPIDLIARMNELKVPAQQAWIKARKENNFTIFAPFLHQIVEINQRMADVIGYQEVPYDALLDRYEPGVTFSRLQSLFTELKTGLSPILDLARSFSPPRTDFLFRDYPEELQRKFGMEIISKFGYDFQRGRLDIAVHPFEVSFTRQDVRITTRYKRNFLPAAIFGMFHECGHGLYEQGADPSITRTVFSTDLLNLYAVAGVSFGTHESQSRLWENLVGRDRKFWTIHFPLLKSYFPEQLADVDIDAFYRSVNTVKPGFIRVEADEVTYNFHIMLRVEIESGLLDGSIKISELPEIWNHKMQEYLGITPPNDVLGVLQDVHWAHGYFGSFCTYTIGNLMSVQFFDAACGEVPELNEGLSNADYRPLLNWLRENIYRHGRAYSPEELLQYATRNPLQVQPYLSYLSNKYHDLFS